MIPGAGERLCHAVGTLLWSPGQEGEGRRGKLLTSRRLSHIGPDGLREGPCHRPHGAAVQEPAVQGLLWLLSVGLGCDPQCETPAPTRRSLF